MHLPLSAAKPMAMLLGAVLLVSLPVGQAMPANNTLQHMDHYRVLPPNPNTPNHYSMVQISNGFDHPITKRLSIDANTEGVNKKVNAANRFITPVDYSSGGFQNFMNYKNYCDEHARSERQKFNSRDNKHNTPYAPPADRNAWISRINSTYASMPNHQNVTNLPPADTDIPRAESIEVIMRMSQYTSIGYCSQANATGMSGVKIANLTFDSLLLGNFTFFQWKEAGNLTYYIAANELQRTLVLTITTKLNLYADDGGFPEALPVDNVLLKGAPAGSRVMNVTLNHLTNLFDTGTSGGNLNQTVSEAIGKYPGFDFVITSHSSVAAVATLAAAAFNINPLPGNVRPTLYTFGEKISMTLDLANFVAQTIGLDRYIRAVSSDDIVPQLGDETPFLEFEETDVMGHASIVNEFFAPMWDEPVIQNCTGSHNDLCSTYLEFDTLWFDHHQWFAGQWIGEEFCSFPKA